MELLKTLISRYKHIRSLRSLQPTCQGKFAFVGIGNHSTNNLYPVLDYLHVPLKYICCKSADKLQLIERMYPNVRATTSLQEVLADEEVKGVFVSVTPEAHYAIASEVLRAGKALFVEKPPCSTLQELQRLVKLRQQAGNVPVAVGLQKRGAPTIQRLKKELAKCKGAVHYNLRYLTGAYPEGDALLDLYIHPLDCVSYLFGRATVRSVECVGNHTLLLVLQHECATGVLELSTAYSWQDAQESLTVNTPKGIYRLEQMESLTYQPKPRCVGGIPLEKVRAWEPTTTDLVRRNNFIPLIANNQLVTQGYFATIKGFVEAVEGKSTSLLTTFDQVVDTYALIEEIRSRRGE